MTWVVSICRYPRWRTARGVAPGPLPKGASASRRWARSQMALARPREILAGARMAEYCHECPAWPSLLEHLMELGRRLRPGHLPQPFEKVGRHMRWIAAEN